MGAAVRAGRRTTLVAWVSGVAAVLATAVAAGVFVAAGQSVPWKPLVLPLVFVAPGVLIAAARPRQATGWLLLTVALFFVGIGLASAHVEVGGADSTGVSWSAWFVDRGSAFLVPCALLALLLLPDGRLPSPRWRPVVAAVIAAQLVTITVFCLQSGPVAAPDGSLPESVGILPNPVGWLPTGWADQVATLDLVVLQLPLLLVPVALAHRVLGAPAPERRRLVTLLLAAGVFAVLLGLGHTAWPALADVLDVVGTVLLVAVVVATVLGPRREIEYVVHHAVVFTVLTVAVTGLYVALAALAAATGSELAPAAVGLVVALLTVALLPVRTRLLQWVTRLVYGERGDPYAAVSRLTASTERVSTTEQAVTEVARSVVASLRVPWAEVSAGTARAEWGRRPLVAGDVTVPLVSAGSEIGLVTVAVPPERRWRDDDRRLLDALARHGGLAVAAIALAEEVGVSRQRLVSAREEERRRVGRDLHDDLGPTLAAIAMQLGALRQLADPGSESETRLGRLEVAARGALDDVRRVARELRPTSLDQFGLVEALRRDAAELGIDLESVATLDVEVPAAVEVAAYRIGQQALVNVAAHAAVGVASLRVAVSPDGLCLEVSDRGPGFELAVEGVGWSSMRERAEELGGSCRVTSTAEGTVVAARLPIPGVTTEVRA